VKDGIIRSGKIIGMESLETSIKKPPCFGFYLSEEYECAKCFFGGQGPGFECPKATKERKEREKKEEQERESVQRQRNVHILRNSLAIIDKMYEGLELGVEHKRKSDGAILDNPRDIIKALLAEGEIECTAPPRRDVADNDEENSQ